MSALFAIFTSDPNLLRCELDRLAPQVRLTEPDLRASAGVTWFSAEDVLTRGFSADSPPARTSDLLGAEPSDALVFHSGPVVTIDEHAQPYRFRRWLFAHAGQVDPKAWPRARMAAEAALPEHLQRLVRGDLDSELFFALFLKELRDLGRTDDVRLEAELAGKLLNGAAHTLDNLALEAGAEPGASSLNAVATNGRLLLASRRGPAPLFYKLLEGARSCERCGITDRTPDSHARAGAHKRLRSVVVCSHPVDPSAWLTLDDGEALAVDDRLNGKKLR